MSRTCQIVGVTVALTRELIIVSCSYRQPRQKHFPEQEASSRTGASCRLVTLAAGAAAGKFLKYEHKAPTVAAQTAYGIEVELEGYEEKYDGSTMLFMDFRRHHSGLWDGTAPR